MEYLILDWLYDVILKLFNECHGAIGDIANIFPELPVELYKSFKEGNYRRAEELHRKIIAIRAIASVGLTPVTFIKEALKLRGLPINTYVRRPLLPLTNG